MRRPRPSLVRRLTLAFLLGNAGVGLLFLLVALYPAALVEDDEPFGPELVQLYLRTDLRFTSAGVLGLKPDAEISVFARKHPDTWFVAEVGRRSLAFGPVPAAFYRQPPLEGLTTARYRNLGARGPAGDALTDTLDIDGRSVKVTSGGVVSADISFAEFLTYSWRNYFFLAPIVVALFNLIGGLIAIPIVLRSVRSTADAAANLDPTDLAKRLPEDGVVKELHPLVRAFNGALDRLSEDAERRRRFIADVAHELRTPLAVLNMHVEALPLSGIRADLQRTVFRLGQMIGQMLDSERLALAARRREQIDLNELARVAVADIAPLAVAHGYEMALVASDASVAVDGDRHAIARALANLLGNAVAHGGGSGTIEVRVSEHAWIDVADEGPGIDPVARERIFDPFHRERWDRDGCGLGLYLVKQIMRAHGGRVFTLGSASGAIFRLEFPPR